MRIPLGDYDLVFDKLAEALQTETETFRALLTPQTVDAEIQELREIDEVRRLAEELEDPEPSTFAST